MKTVTIRLSDVEAAMLAELQARKKEYKKPATNDCQNIADDCKLLV